MTSVYELFEQTSYVTNPFSKLLHQTSAVSIVRMLKLDIDIHAQHSYSDGRVVRASASIAADSDLIPIRV